MVDTQTFAADSLFTIPTGYNSLSAALYVENGTGYVWENVECGIYSAPTNKQLYEKSVVDVQVNGTSVVTNGVANVPVAGPSIAGAVKISADYGVAMSGAYVYLVRASAARCKAGSHDYTPIVPSNQHQSTFYGLAKAAGDTTQAASANPVGTYTDEAKAAIKEMLGVQDGLKVVRLI